VALAGEGALVELHEHLCGHGGRRCQRHILWLGSPSG
jgi:hypothetical protein